MTGGSRSSRVLLFSQPAASARRTLPARHSVGLAGLVDNARGTNPNPQSSFALEPRASFSSPPSLSSPTQRPPPGSPRRPSSSSSRARMVEMRARSSRARAPAGDPVQREGAAGGARPWACIAGWLPGRVALVVHGKRGRRPADTACIQRQSAPAAGDDRTKARPCPPLSSLPPPPPPHLTSSCSLSLPAAGGDDMEAAHARSSICGVGEEALQEGNGAESIQLRWRVGDGAAGAPLGGGRLRARSRRQASGIPGAAQFATSRRSSNAAWCSRSSPRGARSSF